MLISDTLNKNYFGLADPIPKISGALALNLADLQSAQCHSSKRKNCQSELGLADVVADVVADVWHPGWPSGQPFNQLVALLRGLPNRTLPVALRNGESYDRFTEKPNGRNALPTGSHEAVQYVLFDTFMSPFVPQIQQHTRSGGRS